MEANQKDEFLLGVEKHVLRARDCRVRGGRGRGLEEVVRGSAGDVGLSSSRSGVELEERVFHGLVKLHDGSLVAATVAIVGRREDGDDRLLVAPVVALHDELMRSRD